MNITHICEIGTITEGLTYQDNLLSKYHVLCGHNVSIITHCYTRNKDKYVKVAAGNVCNSDGVNVIRLPLKNGKNNMSRFKRLDKLYETIESTEPDILFVHGCQFLDVDILCKFVKNHPMVRMYVDNHSDFTNSATNKISYIVLHRIIWRWVAQQLIPYTVKFYGVLPARVDFLTDVYGIPQEKTELLVMGADDLEVKRAKSENSRRRIREEFGVKDDEILILTGGRIDKYKVQIAQLMEIVHSINNEKLHLIVFGGVSDDIKDRVLSNSYGNVHYIGWVNAADSYSYFEASDLVVFPSRHSVFWEQVTGQGKPMVVRRWQGTEHVDLDGNVIFLETDDPDELKALLERMLRDRGILKLMEKTAVEKGMCIFSYMEIAKRSIRE